MTQFCLIKFKIMSAERNNSTSHLQYDFVRFLRTLQTQIPLKLTGNSKHTANPNPTGLTVSQLSLEKTWFLYREPCSHCRDFPVRKLHRENPVFITGNGFAVYEPLNPGAFKKNNFGHTN